MTINVDFTELQNIIVNEARSAFLEVMQNHEGEEFCGFALYSDESAMTICPSVNSRNHLHNQLAEMPDEALYLKFATAEWAYEYEGASQLRQSNSIISAADRFDSESDFYNFRSCVYDCCVKALRQLAIEGLFGTPEEGEQIALLFSVSDFEDPEMELEWVAQLNCSSITAEFKSYING